MLYLFSFRISSNIIDRAHDMLQVSSLRESINDSSFDVNGSLYIAEYNKMQKYTRASGQWVCTGMKKSDSAPITVIACNNKNQLCTVNANGFASIWNARTLYEEGTLSNSTKRSEGISTVAWNGQGDKLYCGGSNQISMWDIKTVTKAFSFISNAPCSSYAVTSPVTALCVDDMNVLSGHADGIVRIWDARNNDCQSTLKTIPETSILSVHACGDNRYAIHVINHKKQTSNLEIWEQGKFLDSFSCADLGIAYAYDKKAKQLLCASGNTSLTTLDINALEVKELGQK